MAFTSPKCFWTAAVFSWCDARSNKSSGRTRISPSFREERSNKKINFWSVGHFVNAFSTKLVRYCQQRNLYTHSGLYTLQLWRTDMNCSVLNWPARVFLCFVSQTFLGTDSSYLSKCASPSPAHSPCGQTAPAEHRAQRAEGITPPRCHWRLR